MQEERYLKKEEPRAVLHFLLNAQLKLTQLLLHFGEKNAENFYSPVHWITLGDLSFIFPNPKQIDNSNF